MLADLVLVASRASSEAPMGMTAPAACLLLRQFPPASAGLFAEFRRLRASLSPADAGRVSESERKNWSLGPAVVLTRVRHRACPTSRAFRTLQSSVAGVCSAEFCILLCGCADSVAQCMRAECQAQSRLISSGTGLLKATHVIPWRRRWTTLKSWRRCAVWMSVRAICKLQRWRASCAQRSLGSSVRRWKTLVGCPSIFDGLIHT